MCRNWWGLQISGLIYWRLCEISASSCCRCCIASVVSDSVRPHRRQPQAPPSLGFSRQERWSGLPFPSPMHESEKWKWSRSVVSDSSRPHGLQPTGLLCPWDFPGKSTGEGCHGLLRQPLEVRPNRDSFSSFLGGFNMQPRSRTVALNSLIPKQTCCQLSGSSDRC